MIFLQNIHGRVWLFGDNIDTDQILPGYAMTAPREALKNYALAGSSYPGFPQEVRQGDVIVAGKNFGCGSSREQAPVALKEAGVSLIIAQSFARIFRRNCINIGLPVLIADVFPHVQHGDEIIVDIVEAKIKIAKSGIEILGKKLSPNVLETLACGGLIKKVRKQFGLELLEG
jgi:3-isopropylmalate dehydratase small subunit